MASAASSSTAPPVAEMPAPVAFTSERLPSATPARPRRRARIRVVSSRYLSTPLPTPSPRLSASSSHSSTPLPAPSPRLSTSSFHSATPLPAPSPRLSTSSSNSSTPFTRAHQHHHCMPAASGPADENRPPHTPGSRKRGAARDLFEEMHRPRLNPPAPPLATAVAGASSGATATPGPGPRRILCPSSRASPNNITTAAHAHQHRRGCARPSTPARTSFSLYSASPETSAAAIGPRASSHVPFPELRTSPPGTTQGSSRPPNPFCFQALASALPDRHRAKIPAAVLVKPAPSPARKMVVVNKGAAVMGSSKAARKQEDVHKLRILDNRYMQYRFLNAQAEAVAITKKAVNEESLYGLSERIANLQESVAHKVAELECLKRMEKVDFVVDAQVPSLEQWCELEREHISCLSSGTVALRNAASCVPIRGNITINIGGVKIALNSAMEFIKQLSPCAEKLSRKVGEIEDMASELNNVVSNEQVLLQVCGDLLHQAHDMQVMEDSLRIQVMQLKNQTKYKT